MKNIKHLLPPIDEQATEKAVEDALYKALLYKLSDFNEDRREAKVVASYEFQESQRSLVTSDSTSDVALHNVTNEEQQRSHVFKVEKAVSRLHPKHQKLIKERYLYTFGVKDIDVYAGVMDIKTFQVRRTEAFYLLAMFLKVYVLKQ